MTQLSRIDDDGGAVSALATIESSRAMQQVQAAILIAKRFPRDVNQAHTRIMKACERYSLAERAFYSYPRGKENVTGGSIRLAEVIAQNYGNLDFGVVELERLEGRSIALSYCWDLEANVRQAKTFEVAHEMKAGGSMKRLTDPRDIYEYVANMGARRLRSCIFGIIPIDLREDAEKRCREILANGKKGETLEERIRRALLAFKGFGVSQEMIEERIGHRIDLTTGEELVELQSIYNSIRDKQAKRGDFFSFPEDAEPAQGSKAAELSEKLRAAAVAGAKKEEPKP